MKISQIFLYPIKSLGAVEMRAAEVETAGFKYDRRWMLTDASGKFMTQRKYPKMALFKVALQSDSLKVYHKDYPDQFLEIPFPASAGKTQQIQVWEDEMPALLVSKEVDDWFSDMMKMDCRLVKLDPDHQRMIKEKYRVNHEHVSFADSMPYLIIGQASLDDLNSRLVNNVDMLRFRPNLVFSGGKAFDEDNWQKLRVGEVDFKITKPCARCIMTTIDPNTGVNGKEPLSTLSTYRKVGKKVLFGQNMIALNRGKIYLDDPVKNAQNSNF